MWQLPHFFAIAWLYRDDYAAGGLRMIPANDPEGKFTARAMIGTCLLLLPITMLPALFQQAGPVVLGGGHHPERAVSELHHRVPQKRADAASTPSTCCAHRCSIWRA